MGRRDISEKEKEEFYNNPFSRNSDRYTENSGISGLWKKSPFKVKLFIIGGLGAIFLVFIIIVALLSIEPFDFLDFSNETKTKISDDADDTSDYAEEYENTWGAICKEGDTNCTNDAIEESEKYLKQQKKYYKTLKKQSSKLSSKEQNILLTTSFYGYSMDEFSEIGGAYINTSDEEEAIMETSEGAVDYKKEKKSLKGLAKKLKKQGEEGFYEYLKTDDYLDDKPVAQSYYSSYGQLHGLSDDISSWEDEDKQAVREKMVQEIKDIVEEYEDANGNDNALANCGAGEYWWPVGSAETTTEGDVVFASGEPVSSITSDYPDGISSYFGGRAAPKSGASTNHGAIDIPIGTGTNVIAAMDGTVTKAEANGNCGNQVSISDSKGNSLLYCHLSEFKVKAGDTVKQGQLIALSGNTGNSTGPHLHFGILVNGTAVDPTEYTSLSNPRGGGSSSAQCNSGEYVEGGDVQQTVCLTLKSHGYTDSGIAAVLANIAQESSFNPADENSIGCIGLVQWCDTGGRKSQYMAYAGDDWTNVQKQLEFVENELNQSYYAVVKEELMNSSSDSVTQAGYFCCRFEAPEVCGGSNNLTPPAGGDCARRAENSKNYVSYVKNGCK